jgi:hypothetical protein
VLTASADECARKLDELLGVAKAWQPTMDECVGALVWMTPTLNGYFDDWRNSANQLKYEYDGVLKFLQRVDDRDKRSGGKMSIPQIEELAFQAKRLTDQLDPHLHQWRDWMRRCLILTQERPISL